jgi:hypothetical protein
MQNLKQIRKEMAEQAEPSGNELGNFDPDRFETFDDAFMNLLASTTGVLGIPLCYIICDETPQEEFSSKEKRCMYNVPMTGTAYKTDNIRV